MTIAFSRSPKFACTNLIWKRLNYTNLLMRVVFFQHLLVKQNIVNSNYKEKHFF